MNTFILKTVCLCTIFLSHSLFASGHSNPASQKGSLIIKAAYSSSGPLFAKDKYNLANLKFTGTSIYVADGWALSAEYVRPSHIKGLAMGVGLSYPIARSLKGGGAKFKFIPLYSMLRYNLYSSHRVSSYMVGQLGYNALSGNIDHLTHLKGGLYYGLGWGLTFRENIQLECLYAVHKGRAVGTTSNSFLKDKQLNFSYPTFSLSLGYRF